jgi:hypothetical protein
MKREKILAHVRLKFCNAPAGYLADKGRYQGSQYMFFPTLMTREIYGNYH